ncbi:MAG: hypothetical protein AB1768_01685 [Pseudomonadota bacterium]|jgi:hypothetical protein
MIEVEVHLYNSLTKYGAALQPLRLRLPRGTQARALPGRLGIPEREIYVAWRNGRNIMTAFGGAVEDNVTLDHGDRVAFSGPIPFSRGYGAPVC